MQWFVNNWYLVLIAVAFVALHFFMHRGHGGHGGHGKRQRDADGALPGDAAAKPRGGHQH